MMLQSPFYLKVNKQCENVHNPKICFQLFCQNIRNYPKDYKSTSILERKRGPNRLIVED